jgi:2-polyprenyl-3-methyl-5-hydroxy-6-metoxy-1,4-benzoquinol methylase
MLVERANAGLHAHVLERVIAVEPRRDVTVLDVGCGTGALLVQLRARGYQRLIGLDIAPPQAMEGIEFHVADLDDCHAPLPDGSVTLAIGVEVIEHVENVGSLLDELFRTIAPGGRLVVTTPNVHSLDARLRFLLIGQLKQFDRLGDPTHVYPVFQFPFRRVLARHGFDVEAVWGFPEDGSSPTSRLGLRVLTGIARILGLHGTPAGDQLCYVLRRVDRKPDAVAKRAQLVAHY